MSLLGDGVHCRLSLVPGNLETRRVVTCQFSDAHSQLLISTLEAEEPGSAGGTHSEMRLLWGAKQSFFLLLSDHIFGPCTHL